MKATVYKDIPARMWLMKKEVGKKEALTLVSTKAYRRIMDEVERAMRNGGAVTMENRSPDPTGRPPQSGDIQEWISVTIDHEVVVPPTPRERKDRQRRQLRLQDIARAA